MPYKEALEAHVDELAVSAALIGGQRGTPETRRQPGGG
jgi:hypothetical protein